eukprot:s94_g68.t1
MVDKLTSFSSLWLHNVTLTVYERSRDLGPVLLSWLSRSEKEELNVEAVETCHRVCIDSQFLQGEKPWPAPGHEVLTPQGADRWWPDWALSPTACCR